jgi:hypothetical protein
MCLWDLVKALTLKESAFCETVLYHMFLMLSLINGNGAFGAVGAALQHHMSVFEHILFH